jgi:hypothetical protein
MYINKTMNDQPIKTQLNNGIITANSAMPMKDITSNNESIFSMSRRLFNKSFIPAPLFNASLNTSSVIQRESLGLSNKVVIDGTKTPLQKKWIGGNRDASSIISRRKMENTGSILSGSNTVSFKNIKDNNTAKDARNRARSGGNVVPRKVTQREIIIRNITIDSTAYYNIISAGNYYILNNNTFKSGIYNYVLNLAGVQVGNSTPIMSRDVGNVGRSYNLLTISRSNGNTTIYPIYDVFDSTTGTTAANNLATTLNNLNDSVIVIIFSYDEPEANSNLLVTAFKRCGASSSFNTFINYRGAYVLVGIPGIGVNNGLERYIGVSDEEGDPNALINLRIAIKDGNYRYISG